MVQRTYSPVEPKEQVGRTSIQQVQLAPERVDAQRINNQLKTSTADVLLNALLPTAGRLAQQAFERSTEEAYLEGVSQFAAGVSEVELESNPITRAWTTAGHRDTAGRVAVAEAQADLALKLPELAAKEPDDEGGFNQYMAQQRDRLTATLQGMSAKQRAATFAQLANDEIAAQKKYTAARTEYILNQERQSIVAGLTARRDNLELSSTMADSSVYTEEVISLTDYLYGSIWQNDKLPDATKVDMIQQAAEYYASGDHTMVYDALRQRRYVFDDGTEGTLWSKLPLDSQIKIDTAHRKAEGRVKDIRAAEWEVYVANEKSLWNDGIFNHTYDEYVGMALDAVQEGIMTAGQAGALAGQYLEAQRKFGRDSGVSNAFASGDTQRMFELGKSQREGAEAYRRSRAQAGAPASQVMAELVSISVNTGQYAGLAVAGEMLAPALGQLGMSGDIDPENAAMIKGMIDALNEAESTRPGAYSAILEGLPDDQGIMLEMMRHVLATETSDPLDAAERVRTLRDRSTGAVAQEQRRVATQENAALVAEISERQLLGTITGWAKGLIWEDERQLHQLRQRRRWFENSDRVEAKMLDARVAYSEELESLARVAPYMSAESRRNKALAAVSSRVVETEQGSLILPQYQTVHSYFDVPKAVDAPYVGRALGELYKPTTQGGTLDFRVAPDGGIRVVEFDADGNALPAIELDRSAVREKVLENLQKDAKQVDKEVGAGQRFQGASGQVIRANGLNTAGVDTRDMLSLRRNLVKSEDMRAVPYEDQRGIKTVSVGVSSLNTYWEEPEGPLGTYTGAQLQRMFAGASNEAAEVATSSMRSAGISGRHAFLFLGEVAYQSQRVAKDPELLAAMSVGDLAKAEEVFKNSTVWQWSGPERREQYLNNLRKALE